MTLNHIVWAPSLLHLKVQDQNPMNKPQQFTHCKITKKKSVHPSSQFKVDFWFLGSNRWNGAPPTTTHYTNSGRSNKFLWKTILLALGLKKDAFLKSRLQILLNSAEQATVLRNAQKLLGNNRTIHVQQNQYHPAHRSPET